MSETYMLENLSYFYDIDGQGDSNSFPFDGDIESLRKPWITTSHFVPTMIVYGIAFLVGVVGNALVLIAVLRDKKSRSVTTSFMVSLAIADILFLCVCVPYEATKHVIAHWALGPILCKISEFIKMLSAVASILNLSSVSVERFIVIVLPMKSRRWCTAGKSHKILFIVWTMSLLLSSPPLYIMNTEETRYYNNFTSVTLMFCADINVNETGKEAFFVYKLLVMFALPTLVMSVCYTGVIYTLWISSRQLTQLTSLPSTSASLEKVFLRTKNIASNIPCSSESPYRYRNRSPQGRSRNKSADVLKARRQVIKILIAVVVVFLLCWGPPLTMDAILKFSPELGFYNSAFYVKITFGCLPYMQSCMNPFIYCFMSKKFRKSVFSICKSRHCLCGVLICSNKRHHASLVTFEMDSKLSNGTTQTRIAVRNSQSASSDETTCLHSATMKCPS